EQDAAEKAAFSTPEGKRLDAFEDADDPFDGMWVDNPRRAEQEALKAAFDATPQGQRWNKAATALYDFLTTVWAEEREKREQRERERESRPPRPAVEGQCSCDDPEPSAQYECGECGEVFNEVDEGTNRCPSCNKFASRTDVEVC